MIIPNCILRLLLYGLIFGIIKNFRVYFMFFEIDKLIQMKNDH